MLGPTATGIEHTVHAATDELRLYYEEQSEDSAKGRQTGAHQAPEVLLFGHLSKAADVYAFGITL
ncbi:hypothetical protein HaLaN_31033 [Haematococcus lacustris]|uniref:Protein kinase domain-containing protein n=1 Tax=Haematococcus lacustris TaxID=44745 RepID=A0A6A0AH34_HAELA|nr:hypothetical protein HaLaN_31033 [Haematococcus lacustris]